MRGSVEAAALIADCTSCAAASMSRLRSNCSVIWLMPNELDEVIDSQRRDLPELALERRGHQCGDGVGVGARKLRGDLDGGEIDLRQRGDRQPPVAERAAQHHRDAEQRSRDRPVDEGRGDAHARLASAWPRPSRSLPRPLPLRCAALHAVPRRAGCAAASRALSHRRCLIADLAAVGQPGEAGGDHALGRREAGRDHGLRLVLLAAPRSGASSRYCRP